MLRLLVPFDHRPGATYTLYHPIPALLNFWRTSARTQMSLTQPRAARDIDCSSTRRNLTGFVFFVVYTRMYVPFHTKLETRAGTVRHEARDNIEQQLLLMKAYRPQYREQRAGGANTWSTASNAKDTHCEYTLCTRLYHAITRMHTRSEVLILVR